MGAGGPLAGGLALAAAPRQDERGTEIAGRYRILSKLGQGGMGAVYRAEQISLKRTIALKLLRAELSQHAGIVQRFNKEAELAAKLSHPNTVTLFDFGQDDRGTLFIAMELVDGTSLRNVLLREGGLPETRALHIAEQVASSLADAHGHGIVHRDLKPDNVMLRTQGKRRDVVTVLDFGIAKLRDEGEDGAAVPVTQAGDLLGTPQYMAPEQIRAEAVDGRTDVYALGVMLYEMVTGKLPFQGTTVMSILSKHLTDAPTAPETLKPDLHISAGFSGLIMQALEKNPSARPESMEAMADRLSALKGVAVQPGPSGPTITRPPGVPLSLPGLTPNPLFDASVPDGYESPPPMATHGAVAPGQGVAIAAPSMVASTGAAPLLPSLGGGTVRAAGGPAMQATPAANVTPTNRKRRAGLIVGLVAACAVVVVGSIASMGDDTDTTTPDTTTVDPGGIEVTPARPILSKHSDVGGAAWHNPSLNYSLMLPPGFKPEIVDNDQFVRFVSDANGSPTWIVAMATKVGSQSSSDAELIQGMHQLAAQQKGVVIQQAFALVQGKRRLTGIVDVPSLGSRYAFVLYIQGGLAVLVSHGTSVAQFPMVTNERLELFERRVRLP